MRRRLSCVGRAVVSSECAPLAASKQNHGSHGHSHAHTFEPDVRGEYLRSCKIATLTGGVANVFFSITKIWLGSSGGSVALVADGFHAFTDILADAISYVSISLSRKKLPRCRYPFGVGRLETSGAVVVAGILFFGGVALFLQSLGRCIDDVRTFSHVAHFHSPLHGGATTASSSSSAPTAAPSGFTTSVSEQHQVEQQQQQTNTTSMTAAASSASNTRASAEVHGHAHGAEGHVHSHFQLTKVNPESGTSVVMWSMVILAVSSVICKEILFQWTRRVGMRAGSRVVVANAYHHRADAWSGAVALVGVGAQCAGIPGLDGLAGLVVSLSICQIGYGLFTGSVKEFFDFQEEADVSRVREQLQLFHLSTTESAALNEGHFGGGNAHCAECTDAQNVSSSNTTTTTKTSAALQPIRFINVFLTRHGNAFALHVTLLVPPTLDAMQIRSASDKLTALARNTLDVRDTFIRLLVCDETHTVPRANYHEASSHNSQNHDAAEHGHTHTHTTNTNNNSSSNGATVAASGAVVNVDLERCIAALMDTHNFAQPIRYNWEERRMDVLASTSAECNYDVASVAFMFGCTLHNVAEPHVPEASSKAVDTEEDSETGKSDTDGTTTKGVAG